MLTVLVADYLFDGITVAQDFMNVLWVALVLGFLNAVVRPILIVLTIPATILTLGLFLLVINALLIMLADKLLDGFAVASFWYALLFSLMLSLANSFIDRQEKRPSESY